MSDRAVPPDLLSSIEAAKAAAVERERRIARSRPVEPDREERVSSDLQASIDAARAAATELEKRAAR